MLIFGMFVMFHILDFQVIQKKNEKENNFQI